MKKTSIVLLALVFALCAFGQTTTTTAPAAPAAPAAPTTTLANITLPTYVLGGASYNQFTGWSGLVSAIVPETSATGGITGSLYGSVTADLTPVKQTINSKTGYLMGGSFRGGEHKAVYNDGKNVVLVGGDIGAAFSGASATTASGTSTGGLTLGLAGSFTITYVRQLSTHWAVAVPFRMLWMSGVGPGGSGAWNPVVEPSIVWKTQGK